MTDDRRSTEEKLLGRLRLIAAGVILAMVVLIVTVDLFGRLFINPEYHSSELFLGTMIGALLLLLGIEGVSSRLGKGDK